MTIDPEHAKAVKAAMERQWESRGVGNYHKPNRWLDGKIVKAGGYLLPGLEIENELPGTSTDADRAAGTPRNR